MNPEDIVETMSKDEKRSLVNFTPGIWDARSVFDRYVQLVQHRLLALGEDPKKHDCMFTWTDLGRDVLFAIQNPEIGWFWCDACKAWLHDDNTVHSQGVHE